MKNVNCKKDNNWLGVVLDDLATLGFSIVTDVLDEKWVAKTRGALYEVQEKIVREVGQAKLDAAGELGVLRLMFKYDPFFLQYLAIPEVLGVIDKTVSDTAILHLQNGFINPSFAKGTAPKIFQNQFHMDFPRVLNGYLTSINLFFAISDFTIDSGATLLVPASHQKLKPPTPEYLMDNSIAVECPAGSMLVFDSTLWHAAGNNVSGSDRLAINHQFTRSYIKQQMDYVRALDEKLILQQKPRTQQLLGYYTRVVTSLDEYYRPAAERLYRKGQG